MERIDEIRRFIKLNPKIKIYRNTISLTQFTIYCGAVFKEYPLGEKIDEVKLKAEQLYCPLQKQKEVIVNGDVYVLYSFVMRNHYGITNYLITKNDKVVYYDSCVTSKRTYDAFEILTGVYTYGLTNDSRWILVSKHENVKYTEYGKDAVYPYSVTTIPDL